MESDRIRPKAERLVLSENGIKMKVIDDYNEYLELNSGSPGYHIKDGTPQHIIDLFKKYDEDYLKFRGTHYLREFYKEGDKDIIMDMYKKKNIQDQYFIR